MAQAKTYVLYCFTLLWCLCLSFSVTAQSDNLLGEVTTEKEETQQVDTIALLKKQFPNASEEKLREYLERLGAEPSDGASNAARNKEFIKFARQYQTPSKYHTEELKIKQTNTRRYNSSKFIREEIEVKGWHPYWLEDSHKGYPYNLLTTISYFSYELNPSTGACKSQEMIDNWMSTSLIDSAQAHDCKVLLNVSNYGYEANEIFLDSVDAQVYFIERILVLLERRGANGIDINFEGLPEEYGDKFVQFVKRVHTVFERKKKGYVIHLGLPVKDYSKVFKVHKLRKYVDKFSITSYNYEYSHVHKKPLAPLSVKGDGVTESDLSASAGYYVDMGVNPKDLIVAFPYYGVIWGEYSRIIPYEQIGERYKGAQPVFDSTTSTMYFRIMRDGVAETCWFDDENSLGVKYNWILGSKLGGVGLFALGYDNNNKAFWNLIESKFSTGARSPVIAPFFQQLKWRYKNTAGFTLLFSLCSLGFFMFYFVQNWRIQEAISQERLLALVFTVVFFAGILMLYTYWNPWINTLLLFVFGLLAGAGLAVGISWLVTQVINRIP